MVNREMNDIIWSYIGNGIEMSTYLVLTPLLARTLTPSELGFWYTLYALYFFVVHLDSGFSPMMIRNAAVCMSGVHELKMEGIQQIQANEPPNYGLLRQLFKTYRQMLAVTSALVLILMVALGIPYVQFITRDITSNHYILTWVIFSIAVCIHLLNLIILGLLKGTGHIAAAQKIISFSRLIQFVICIVGVLMGYGVMAMAIGYAIGSIISQAASYIVYRSTIGKHIRQAQPARQEGLYKTIWHNTWRLLLVGVCGYCGTQGLSLLTSAYLGLDVTASYGLTLQGFQASGILATVVLQVNIPELSSACARGDTEQQKRVFSKSVVSGWIIMIILGAAVVWLANPVLSLIRANTFVLPVSMALLTGLIALIERNHYFFIQYLNCKNTVPYVCTEILAGIFIVTLAFVALRFMIAGLIGMLIMKLLVYLCYNGWFWERRTLQQLNCSFARFCKTGIEELANRMRGLMKDE